MVFRHLTVMLCWLFNSNVAIQKAKKFGVFQGAITVANMVGSARWCRKGEFEEIKPLMSIRLFTTVIITYALYCRTSVLLTLSFCTADYPPSFGHCRALANLRQIVVFCAERIIHTFRLSISGWPEWTQHGLGLIIKQNPIFAFQSLGILWNRDV